MKSETFDQYSFMHEYISDAHSGPLQTSKIKLSANAKSSPSVFPKSFILGAYRVADFALGTKGYRVFNIQRERISLIANKDDIIDH